MVTSLILGFLVGNIIGAFVLFVIYSRFNL